MAELEVKELEDVVVRFSGDSGDGMQLAGNIFSTVSATVGNGISTFPDYPADIRAPHGSLTGVSGYQVHIGEGQVYTPGDKCDVLVAMNAAALKTQYRHAKPLATIIIDADSFGPADLKKAQFMQGHIGEKSAGVISSVTGFGLFVELPNTVEGLIHVSTMDDDHYTFVENSYLLLGERTHKQYRLGDPIKIVVTSADVSTRRVDFAVDEDRPAGYTEEKHFSGGKRK